MKQRVNFQNSNSISEVCKNYSGSYFWLNNQAFVIALNKVPKTKKHHVKCRAYSLTMRCFGDVFEKPSTSMFLTMFFKTQNIEQTMHLTGRSTLAHRTSAHHFFGTSAHQYPDISSSKSGHLLIKYRTSAHQIFGHLLINF